MREIKRRDEYQIAAAITTERYLNIMLNEYFKIFKKRLARAL